MKHLLCVILSLALLAPCGCNSGEEQEETRTQKHERMLERLKGGNPSTDSFTTWDLSFEHSLGYDPKLWRKAYYYVKRREAAQMIVNDICDHAADDSRVLYDLQMVVTLCNVNAMVRYKLCRKTDVTRFRALYRSGAFDKLVQRHPDLDYHIGGLLEFLDECNYLVPHRPVAR